jgi:hypothetical protein
MGRKQKTDFTLSAQGRFDSSRTASASLSRASTSSYKLRMKQGTKRVFSSGQVRWPILHPYYITFRESVKVRRARTRIWFRLLAPQNALSHCRRMHAEADCGSTPFLLLVLIRLHDDIDDKNCRKDLNNITYQENPPPTKGCVDCYLTIECNQ